MRVAIAFAGSIALTEAIIVVREHWMYQRFFQEGNLDLKVVEILQEYLRGVGAIIWNDNPLII